MKNTVVGIFENRKEAVKAVDNLLYSGFDRNDIDISSDNASNYDVSGNQRTNTDDSEDGISRFFNSLFGSGDNADKHTEVGRRGTIVTVHTHSSEEAERATSVLDEFGSVDVDERANYYRSNDMDITDTEANRTTTDIDSDRSIPVVEEEMQAGKREVNTGGVRVRSRIVERPVEEHLRLREEHVHVERTPVDRPATEADFQNFEEGEIEMTERSEEAVTSKKARVTEEVRLHKDVEEREETIHDTVRHTEVETEDLRNEDSDRDRDVTYEDRENFSSERRNNIVDEDEERYGTTDEEEDVHESDRRRGHL